MLMNISFISPKICRLRALIKPLFFVILLALQGCSKPDVDDYRENNPSFSFKDYFSGPVEGWGLLQDFNGKMVKSFTLQLDCEWQDTKGTIKEVFNWSDGTTTERVWTVEQIADNHFKGCANEMSSQAIGHAAGNVMNWKYELKIPINGELIEFNFDDWTFAIDGNVIINRSRMKKMGFTLGELTVVMKKQNIAPAPASPML